MSGGTSYRLSSSKDLAEYRGLLGSACMSASFTSTLYSTSVRGPPLLGSPLPSTCASVAGASSVFSSTGSLTGSFVGSVDDMVDVCSCMKAVRRWELGASYRCSGDELDVGGASL
jgi:hypothetical protein